jgi:hypothetical protein
MHSRNDRLGKGVHDIPMKFALLSFLVALSTAVRADVALSIRYFKTEGTSHYHLYLYGDDGRVIRQLTAPEDAQDTAPMFSMDGSMIYFTREQHGRKQIFSLRPNGTQLHAVEEAPAGYPPRVADQAYEAGGDNDSLWQVRGKDLFLTTPDGKQEVILNGDDNFKHSDPSFEANAFKALTIRDPATGQEKHIPTGGDEEQNYCDLATRAKSPFLILPGLRLAFYWQWQGSTDGPRLGALDLTNQRTVFLSQNPAIAIPHGTRTGFFCVCQDRYQPLGKTTHTVNCLYLDWWDGNLQRTRFAGEISLFGGASVRFQGQPQLNIRGKE